ncbi:MAG TPA: flagellar biosynthesis anti-sigma factor FlgM [Myxococcota bacterium]
MRVNDTPTTARVAGVAESRGTASPATPDAAQPSSSTPADKVSVEGEKDEKAITAEVRRQVGDVRQERLAEIEAAVRNGTYKPDPRAIAERILQAAALDATLAANMRK